MSRTKEKEEWKTWGDVFDEFTFRTLFKLKSQGHFDKMLSPVSIGKESNVFTAEKEGSFVIIKIYRLSVCDFNRMYDYIKFDARFLHLRKNRRKVVFSWTQREYRNLLKAREANVRVPTPIAFMNNVLVEEFIGDKAASPKLKDLLPRNKKKFFDKVVLYMERLNDIGLAHGDLSEYNILNFNDEPVFIDMSQATTRDSGRYDELLERDIKNMARFFNKIGLKTSEEDILTKIKR